MKITTLGACAIAGMLTVGSVVYAVTPAGGFGQKTQTSSKASASAATTAQADDSASVAAGTTDGATPLKSEFSVGSTLKVDGRLAQAKMLAGSSQDTFVLLELTADSAVAGKSPRIDLSLVIDKSGSMAGGRIKNALAAAVTAVQRLKDGDTVSVVAFDTKTELVVPPTVLSSASRTQAIEKIRGILLGGDTCISCGIEEGLSQLGRTGGSNGVKRMLLLSDGAPTAGIRDESGFTEVSQRAMKAGVNITTVGVDVDFNERVMTAIALASNGRHYFVENEAGLPKVFDDEAVALEQTVADSAVATIELSRNVEFVQVADRTFERSGSRITVPLGGFTKGARKTVLLKVRVPASAAGTVEVGKVRVAYRDLSRDQQVDETGTLEVELTNDRTQVSEMDGVVLDRVQRSETAAALGDANELFRRGKIDEARQRLEEAKKKLQTQRNKAAAAAPKPRARQVDDSFQSQAQDLDRASGGFATPPPPSPTSKAPAPPAAAVEREHRKNERQNASDRFKSQL